MEKENDQSKVWEKVDQINKVNKTLTSTKSYTALTHSADFTKKLNGYLKFFRNKFDAEPNIIGVVVVIGNKVLGCDLFATSDLFNSQFQSLLHSYATEAVMSGKPVTASTLVVKAYMVKLLKDEDIQKVTLKQKGYLYAKRKKT